MLFLPSSLLTAGLEAGPCHYRINGKNNLEKV
jgi:hypothetical protein